ncbi:hypothetical protein Nepgr_021838 [Nepenthes gracilis]|uniref:Uncharacterized protein n=1 Tax=Nepenthes gracilis TaxID=150966 RepID=A0AAD3T0R7_NEPGR|nr:hypothetical protein Nepgr_021838 [Nepenthes gracilis]
MNFWFSLCEGNDQLKVTCIICRSQITIQSKLIKKKKDCSSHDLFSSTPISARFCVAADFLIVKTLFSKKERRRHVNAIKWRKRAYFQTVFMRYSLIIFKIL